MVVKTGWILGMEMEFSSKYHESWRSATLILITVYHYSNYYIDIALLRPGSQLQDCSAHKQNVGQAEIKIGTYFPKLICNCFNWSRLEWMMVFLTWYLSCLPRNSISFTSWTPTLGYLEGMLWMSKISEEKEKVNMWAKNMRQNYGLKVAKLLIG